MGKLTIVLIWCAFHAGTLNTAVDITKNLIMEKNIHHTNYEPVVTTLNVARRVPIYSQKRISYSSGAAPTDYVSGSNVGATGDSVAEGSSNNNGAVSTMSSSYGSPSSGGYGSGGASSQGPMTYYYYHYPGMQDSAAAASSSSSSSSSSSQGNGWGSPDSSPMMMSMMPMMPMMGEGGGEDGGLGSITSVLGALLPALMGVLSMKGLLLGGLLPLLKLAKLLLPLLLPLLLLFAALLLFIPIPVITIPAGGRSMEGQGIRESALDKLSQDAQNVLMSSQCFERIICEMNRRSQGTYIDSFVKGICKRAEPYLPKKWLRLVLRAYLDSSLFPKSSKCSKIPCELPETYSNTVGGSVATEESSSSSHNATKPKLNNP